MPNDEVHHLEPKVMDVFVCLAEHANQLVTRDQLLETAWHERDATDELLTRAIGGLRRALHDDRGNPQYIETVPKRGYRLIGQIRLLEVSELEISQVQSASITPLSEHKLVFVTVTLLALTLVYIAYDKIVIGPPQQEAIATTSILGRNIDETNRWESSIAVLPFVNMSEDPRNEYFADGLSEEILTLLTRVPELKVIGRTSSFAFKGKDEDLRVIGDALGVKTVLEGSVRKSGEQVRITAQLVDVADGSHIWSESYDRSMTDVFAVQDDVASAIIDALQIHVGANPTRGRPTDNAKAYALFLRARTSLNAFALRDAEELLFQAIEIDPRFAEAYELLAVIYWRQSGESIKAETGQELTRDAAAKALSIDPDLVLAQAFYQATSIETFSFFKYLESFERVLREQPSNTEPLNTLAWELLLAGYLQEALGLAERYVDLDPLSMAAHYRLADALLAVGRTNEAVAALELADQLGSDSAKWAIGDVNLMEKQDDIAIAHFEAALQQNGLPSNWVRELVSGARDPETGQAYLDYHIPHIVASVPEEDAFGWQLRLTRWYLIFGFLDRYFELILTPDLTAPTWADAEGLVYAGIRNRLLGFTAQPKYLEVVESLDFIELWEQRGPPDFCENVHGEWICR